MINLGEKSEQILELMKNGERIYGTDIDRLLYNTHKDSSARYSIASRRNRNKLISRMRTLGYNIVYLNGYYRYLGKDKKTT